jgi:hypothetical protein
MMSGIAADAELYERVAPELLRFATALVRMVRRAGQRPSLHRSVIRQLALALEAGRASSFPKTSPSGSRPRHRRGDGSVDQVAAETLSERARTEKGAVASVRPTGWRCSTSDRPLPKLDAAALTPHANTPTWYLYLYCPSGAYPGDKLGVTRRIWYTSMDEHVYKTAG